MNFEKYGIKHIIFDADGTLLKAENPYLSLAEALDCDNEVRNLVNQYLSRQISYTELVNHEVEIFTKQYKDMFGFHPRTGDLERFLPVPEIKKGVSELIDVLHDRDIQTHVISSGFFYLVEVLAKFKIKVANIYANKILYDTKGNFVNIKIDVSGDKIESFKQLIKTTQLDITRVAYVGDNAFDEILMEYILKRGGWVLFLKQEKIQFKLEGIPEQKKFIVIKKLSDIYR